MKKNMIRILALLMVGYGMVYLSSCKSKDNGPSALTISTATASSTDINGATAATGIASSPTIVVTFNTAVDATTATNANITLTRDFDHADVPLTITTAGDVVTIVPTTQPLFGGALYVLAISSGVKSTGGLVFTSVTRSFTTTGTFLPSGQVAHWGFENNVNDDAGSGTNYNAATADIIDLTYVAGRNTAAGQAGSFNGSTSIAEIPNGDKLVNTSDFTLSLWVKPNYNIHPGFGKADTVGNFVLGMAGVDGFEWEFSNKFADGKMAAQYAYTGGHEGQDLWMDCTGNLGWQGWTYSKDLTSSGGLKAIVPNAWSQIICTYVSSTKIGSIYLNGTLMKTQDFNKWPAGDNLQSCTGLSFTAGTGLEAKLALGYYCSRGTTAFSYATYSDPTANHLSGLLDDVRIFHTAITAAEVTLMYNSEKP